MGIKTTIQDKGYPHLWEDGDKGVYTFRPTHNEIRYAHHTGEHWTAHHAEYHPDTHSLTLLNVVGIEIKTLTTTADSELDQRWAELAQREDIPVVALAQS